MTMKVDVLDMKGKKVRELDLPAKVFEAPVNVDLMHQAFVRQEANGHLGTHETKVRSEVSGGGRKPWRQKGTGRARQGSTRAAQWVGGGRIHTPHPRSYEQRMPKRMRQAALRSALSVRVKDSSIVVVDEFTFKEPRTRLMAETLNRLVGGSSALVVLPAKDASYEAVMRSADNLKDTKVLLAAYLNVRDVLGFEKIVVPLKAVEVLAAHLG
jgi:large subunit ribosomal protein L4